MHLYIFSCLSVFGLYAIYFVFLGLSVCLSRCLRYSFLSFRPPLCAYLFYSKINSRSKQATHTLADKSSSWGCAAAAAVWMCVRQVANLLLPLFPNWKQLRILAVFKLNFIPSSCCCFSFFCCEIFLEIHWEFRFVFHKINIYNVSGLWHVRVIQQSRPIDLTFWLSVRPSVAAWESNTISTNFLFIRMRQQFFYCKDTHIHMYMCSYICQLYICRLFFLYSCSIL